MPAPTLSTILKPGLILASMPRYRTAVDTEEDVAEAEAEAEAEEFVEAYGFVYSYVLPLPPPLLAALTALCLCPYSLLNAAQVLLMID